MGFIVSSCIACSSSSILSGCHQVHADICGYLSYSVSGTEVSAPWVNKLKGFSLIFQNQK